MSSKFHEYLERKKALTAQKAPVLQSTSPLDRQLTVTYFADHGAFRKDEKNTSLRALCSLLENTQAPSKAQLPWLKLARFGDKRTTNGSYRNNDNVLSISGIEADYDGEKLTVDRARTILENAGLAAIIYTSPSHTADKPRWRVLCPTSQDIEPDRRMALVARVNGLFLGALSRESFTLSQSYYYGFVTGNTNHQVVVVEGKAIDLADELDGKSIGKSERGSGATLSPHQAIVPYSRSFVPGEGTAYGLSALENECRNIRGAQDGNKHHAVNKAGYCIGGLVASGELQEGIAFSELTAALEQLRPHCKDWRAAQNTLKNAFDNGKRAPRDVPEQVHEPVDLDTHPAAALIAKAVASCVREEDKPQPIADGLMDVDGILKMMVDECVRTAIRPQPFLALGAAICTIGALAGRRYRTQTDLRTNLYVIAIAESGGGKDHPAETVRRCMDDAGLGRYLGGETLASGRAVLSSLEAHPSKLFQIDEVGLFLRGVTGSKAAQHKADIWSELMKLYSRAKGVYRGTEYANKKEAPRIDINQPCVNFYGTSTPSTFWSALEGGAMTDGSLARFLLFVSDNNRPERNPQRGIFEPSKELLDGLRSIAMGGVSLTPGNIPGGIHAAPMTATDIPTLLTVRADAEADARNEEGLALEDEWASKVAGTHKAAIVNRLGENAAKLALISAISRSPNQPVINGRDMDWGWKLAQHCATSLLRDAERFIASNEFEGKLNKALNIIREHGPCTTRDMYRYGWRLAAREQRDVLDTLVSNGVVTAHEIKADGPGRPTIRYTVSHEATNQNA